MKKIKELVRPLALIGDQSRTCSWIKLNTTFLKMLPTDPGLYLLCFKSTLKCFKETGNSHSTDAQTDVLQRGIHSSLKSHLGIEVPKNYHLQNLPTTDSHSGCYHLGVPVHPEVIGAHKALASFPISYLMATS